MCRPAASCSCWCACCRATVCCCIAWPGFNRTLVGTVMCCQRCCWTSVWHPSLVQMTSTRVRLQSASVDCTGPMDISGAAKASCRSAWRDQYQPRHSVQQCCGGVCFEPGGVPAHWQDLGADNEYCWCGMLAVICTSSLLHTLGNAMTRAKLYTTHWVVCDAGVVKDWMLIGLSVWLYKSPVSAINLGTLETV